MATTKTTGTHPRVLSAGTLTGDEVRNPAGEKLGDIKELMIDANTGRIAYAVLSFGGIFGIGDKLFAVPWDALQIRPDEHCFILDVDKQQIEDAEGFDKDNWPNFADPMWHSRTYTHFHIDPYWE